MDQKRVRDIMIPRDKVVTIGDGERLSVAEDIMTLGKVRHMPVVRGGELIGVVSERDLLRASPSSLVERRAEERRAFLDDVFISQVMTADPFVIDPSAFLAEAAKQMVKHRIGCLPVVEQAELVGLITETDLLRCLGNLPLPPSAKLSKPSKAAKPAKPVKPSQGRSSRK